MAPDRLSEPITSLVFPAYNPGPGITEWWQEVESFLSSAPGNWEILVVCDGCTDGTQERLARLTGHRASVRVVSHSPNRGKGYAVRSGLLAARGRWRIFTDIDLAYGMDQVLSVAEGLWAGGEVIIGSRSHPQSRAIIPCALQGYTYRRHIQSKTFNALARLLLPIRTRDTQAGLKGLSARAVNLVIPQLTCDGFGFDCELLTACSRYGLEIQEVPVLVRYEDRATTARLGSLPRMVRDLWRIRRNWRSPPPPLAIPLDPAPRKAA